MVFIEFLGPPGAGKSTIHSALVDSSAWYHPKPVPAGRRRFSDTANPTYRLLYRLMPSRLRPVFENAVLTDRYQREAMEEFATHHPKALQEVALGIGSIEDEPWELFKIMRRAIERYQLGVDTVRDGETLCLDESFAMGAVSILQRRPTDTFSLETYLQHAPTPRASIHVTSPPDVCLERQRERGRIALPEPSSGETLLDVQSNIHDLCTAVADQQRRWTTVLEVESTSTPGSVVEQIETRLGDSPTSTLVS